MNVLAGDLKYYIVGLPDNAVKESMQRIESAIKTNEYYMPRTKIVVNLAPADIKRAAPLLICLLPSACSAPAGRLMNPNV